LRGAFYFYFSKIGVTKVACLCSLLEGGVAELVLVILTIAATYSGLSNTCLLLIFYYVLLVGKILEDY